MQSKTCLWKFTVGVFDSCEGENYLLWRCTNHLKQRKGQSEARVELDS